MKNLHFFLFLLIFSSLLFAQKIYYLRNNQVWFSNLDGSDQKKIIDLVGYSNPSHCFSISQSGNKFAFINKTDNERNTKSLLNIYDIKKTKLSFSNKYVLNYNLCQVSFSPNGEDFFCFGDLTDTSYYSLMAGITIVSNNTMTFLNTSLLIGAEEPLVYSWTQDCKSISFIKLIDPDSIYTLSIDNKNLNCEKIDLTIKDGMLGSILDFIESPNKKYFAFLIDILDDGSENFYDFDKDPLYGAVYIYNRENGSCSRLTPKSVFCDDFCPIWKDNETLFLTVLEKQENNELDKITSNIYQYNISDLQSKLILKDAELIGFSESK